MPSTEQDSSELNIPPPTLHLVTPPDAPSDGPTLLYFHGGGFVNPLRAAAHMPFILGSAAVLKAARVVILEYDLAPEHPYPAQLAQCVAALSYLVNDLSTSPNNIVLAGDSAGGQLVAALLAHLVQPSPDAPRLSFGSQAQFKAALLVSPCTRFPADTGSYKANDGKDYLTKKQVDEFKAAWAAKEDDIWANLCGLDNVEPVWKQVFAGPQRLVNKVMITVGTAEILLDDCRVFAKDHVGAETVAANRDTGMNILNGLDAVLVECEGEVHVQVALDSVVGYRDGVMMHAIKSWLAGV